MIAGLDIERRWRRPWPSNVDVIAAEVAGISDGDVDDINLEIGFVFLVR